MVQEHYKREEVSSEGKMQVKNNTGCLLMANARERYLSEEVWVLMFFIFIYFRRWC